MGQERSKNLHLVLCTSNLGKLSNLNRIANDFPGIHCYIIRDEIPQYLAEEIQGTLENISYKKAWDFHNYIEMSVLSDDTGFYITEMGKGFPGPYIKGYLAENSPEEICKKYAGSEAFFKVCLTLVVRSDIIFEVTKTLKGTISEHPSEVKNPECFDFDYFFIPDHETVVFAELSREKREAISPRFIATREILEKANPR